MYFYYFGIIFTCLGIFYIYYQSQMLEAFDQKIKQIFCVGDSMLNNAHYVGAGESVLDCLQMLGSKNCNYVMLAKDGARLSDVFQQIDTLTASATGSDSCMMVVSVGGNDILSEAKPVSQASLVDAETLEYFQIFLKLVKSIHVRFDRKMQIFVLNLYYPGSKKRFHDRIRQWNAWLDEHALTAGYTVIHTDSVMTEADDICYKIEPSPQGGEKIAGLIIANTCSN